MNLHYFEKQLYFIITRPTLSLFLLKGLATKHPTVKWTIPAAVALIAVQLQESLLFLISTHSWNEIYTCTFTSKDHGFTQRMKSKNTKKHTE